MRIEGWVYLILWLKVWRIQLKSVDKKSFCCDFCQGSIHYSCLVICALLHLPFFFLSFLPIFLSFFLSFLFCSLILLFLSIVYFTFPLFSLFISSILVVLFFLSFLFLFLFFLFLSFSFFFRDLHIKLWAWGERSLGFCIINEI